ncbi:MAG: acyl-CoA dehydrogenase family protein, partial [Candidatus Caldarchaeum sp.]
QHAKLKYAAAISALMLSEEHQIILQTAEKVGRRVGRRYWLSCARDKRPPELLWSELKGSGLTAAGVNLARGQESGLIEAVLVQEGLARAGIPLLQFLTTHLSRTIVLRHGSASQFKTFVEPTCLDGRKISLCLTEAEAGSDTWRIKTFAERRGGSYVLSGQKTFITGARESDFMLVVARTRKYDEVPVKREGISLFLFETGSSGVSFEPLGIELYSPETQYTVYFDELQLGEENLVGMEGRGVDYLFDGLNVERILIAACSVGLGDHVLGRAVEYAGQRVVFGKPIGSYQGLQLRMARAKAYLEAARSLVYEASELYDSGKPASGFANMAKVVGAEAALEAFEAAMQVFGGNAYDTGTDVITFYPVIRLFSTAPVTNELALSHIGRHVLGLPKSY